MGFDSIVPPKIASNFVFDFLSALIDDDYFDTFYKVFCLIQKYIINGMLHTVCNTYYV